MAKRGGKRPGAGRKKKVKLPAGRPTNPDQSVIQQTYDLLDMALPELMGRALYLARNSDNEKIKAKVLLELIGKRIPTATASISLDKATKIYTDEELAAMSDDELLEAQRKMFEGAD